MQELQRQIYPKLKANITPQKVLVLLGARRTGKTMLLKKLMGENSEPALMLNGESAEVWEAFSRRTVNNFLHILDGRKLLIIDEAQKVPGIGESLKLMVDEIPGFKAVITGSSAFDIGNKTGEPLTGRNKTFRLFPLSEIEYTQTESKFEKREAVRERLIFGNYPELLHCATATQKIDYLRNLLDSYLLKDILAFEGIRNSYKILQLLKLVAFQTGSEVSLSELGRQLQISKNTVERYLDLLEKVFIIHRLGGYSRNLRKEVTKQSKWYFFDNGIRNVLINNMQQTDARDDVGRLWENYIIAERLKQQQYAGKLVSNYFWRTYDGQEIDFVEEREGNVHAYEMKWAQQKIKTPGAWKSAYPRGTYQVISKENYYAWLETMDNIQNGQADS